MRLGLNLGDVPPQLGATEQLDVYRRQVVVGQQAGFADFFVGHHYAYRSARWLQPIPLLARLSADLLPESRIGTGVLVAPLLHPVALAEEAAALVAMAPGRVVLGLGIGYRRLEYEAIGVPWEERQARLRRTIEIVREQWSGATSVIDGVEVPSGCRLEPELWPRIVMGVKSVQGARAAGQLGVGLLGASKQRVDRLVEIQAAHRAAWQGPGPPPPMILMRNLSFGADRDDAGERLLARSAARMAGYQHEGLPLGAASPFEESEDVRETALLGRPDEVRAELEELAGHLDLESVLLRAQWPDLPASDVGAWLTEVGAALAPAAGTGSATQPVTTNP